MTSLSAALGREEVVVLPFPQDVRTLGDAVVGLADDHRRGERAAGANVDLGDVNGEVLELQTRRALGHAHSGGEIDLVGVVIPEELRRAVSSQVRLLLSVSIDRDTKRGCLGMQAETYILIESRVVEVDRVGPRIVVVDVVRPDVKSTWEDAFLQMDESRLTVLRQSHKTHIHRRAIAMEQAIGKIPPLLRLPVPQCARPAPGAGLDGAQVILAATVQGMADELPVQEIGGGVDGAAWEVLKRRRADEVDPRRGVCGRHGADGRVRVEAPDDGVDEGRS